MRLSVQYTKLHTHDRSLYAALDLKQQQYGIDHINSIQFGHRHSNSSEQHQNPQLKLQPLVTNVAAAATAHL